MRPGPRPLAFLLAVLIVTAWSPHALSFPIQNPGNGHYYDLISGAIPWAAARDAAAAQTFAGVPGHLATIADASENNWIISTFSSGSLGNVWLGGFQNLDSPLYSEPAGGWEWVTGEPATFSNWSSGEPNGGPDSDYMEIKNPGSPPGSWNDVQGGEPNNRGYLVEFDVTPGPTPPTTPSSCNATDSLNAWVAITWADVANESGYRIYRNSAPVGIRGPDVTSFTDFPPAGSYLYCVEAFNGAGVSSPCCEPGTKLLAPPRSPHPCSASDNSSANVTITWTDVLDEEAYIILRNGVQIATVGANITSYVDTPVVGTFTYCVYAANAAGSSTNCCDSGRRLPPPPPAPSACNASDNSTTVVVFAWTDVAGEDGYRIYRNSSLMGTVGPGVLSFVDNAAQVGVTYQYCVEAFNITGASPTCCDNGTRIPPPPPTPAPGMDPARLGLLLTLLGAAGSAMLKRKG